MSDARRRGSFLHKIGGWRTPVSIRGERSKFKIFHFLLTIRRSPAGAGGISSWVICWISLVCIRNSVICGRNASDAEQFEPGKNAFLTASEVAVRHLRSLTVQNASLGRGVRSFPS